ncbi:MAG: pseudouridine synthase [Cyclobacteriaceae bacterium]|jgi:23S rRNA pseudouridine2605 synthase
MAYQKPGRGKGRSSPGSKGPGRASDRKSGSGDRKFSSSGDRKFSSSGDRKFSSSGDRKFSSTGDRKFSSPSGGRKFSGGPGGRSFSGGSKFGTRRREDDREDSGKRSYSRPGRSFEGREGREGRERGESFERRAPRGPKKFGAPTRGFKRDDEKPKEERKRSPYYGKPFGKPDFSKRKPRGADEDKKSFVQSRLSRQRKFIRESSSAEEKPASDEIRLNKYISNSGICSRREADNLITMGLVTVNGQTITEMGYKVKRTDDIRYEGKKLTAEKPVYILLNKPKGFITTTEDPQERNTVMNLIAGACKERVYPVGRLDRNTTGLLLFTNDGELAEKLTHPSYNVRKIYKVDLDRPLTKADLQKIREGIFLEEGRAVVDDLAIVDDSGKTVGIELHIGWNRIVRRIFEALNYQVVKLDRVVYAGLDKKDLARGKWRFLKETEVIKLKHFNKK